MKSVVHYFKKKPNPKNLANRSLSFSETELDHVASGDDVMIDVITPTGLTKIHITGKDLCSNLMYRTAKNGTKIKVFRF